MILYNVTVSVDEDIHEEWLKWMKEEHVPDVLATGMFTKGKIARILAEEAGGLAYSVQYYAPTMEHFEKYERDFAQALRADHENRYSGRTAAFRTLLHIVHEVNEKG